MEGTSVLQEQQQSNRLISAIAVVEFDIDIGQVVRHIYPKQILSPQDEKIVSNLAFPDSNAFTQAEGSMDFIFRMKRSPQQAHALGGVGGRVSTEIESASVSSTNGIPISTCSTAAINTKNNSNQMNNNSSRFMLGYTCFSQRKDAENTRGNHFEVHDKPRCRCAKNSSKEVFQMDALIYRVLLDFNKVQSIICNDWFIQDLRDSFEEISSWKIVEGGFKNQLIFRGQNLELEIPWYLKVLQTPSPAGKTTKSEKQQLELVGQDQDNQGESDGESSGEEGVVQSGIIQNKSVSNQNPSPAIQSMLRVWDCAEEGYFQEINIFRILKRAKVHLLWKLWEVMLTNQPLMIIADSPHVSSQLVFAAISLISPLQYIGDYRPYLTIYDSEYKAIKDRCDQNMPRNLLVGVTNPFFLKTLANYPVILRLDSAYSATQSDSKKKKEANGGAKEFPFMVNQKNMKILIQYDKEIERRLLNSDSAESDAINNSFVRKQFRSLTTQFLGVFDEYLNAQRNDVKIFDKKEFRKFLEKRTFGFGGLFEKKKHIIKLYDKFMISANFLSFIKQKNNIYFSKTTPLLLN